MSLEEWKKYAEEELKDMDAAIDTPHGISSANASKIQGAALALSNAAQRLVELGMELQQFEMIRLGYLVNGLIGVTGFADQAALKAVQEILEQSLLYNSTRTPPSRGQRP